MKLKVAISNFGSSQVDYLNQVVEEYRKFSKYHVDLTVYSTVPIDPPHRMVCSSVGLGLPFSCRDDMAKEIAQHDLFLYSENDMLITEDNIDAFLLHQQRLPDGEVSGFYRYEINNGVKLLLDLNPYWGKIVTEVLERDFRVENQHQGSFLLTRAQLQRCIDSGEFLVSPRRGPYGILEQGASDPYTNCGLKKVFPRDLILLERLGIRHLPLKYTTRDQWKTHGITFDQLPVS
jgi:hypothetical protein